MKTRNQLKQILGQHQQTLERDYKVKSIALFGSYVRDEQTPASDVDIMVEFSEPVGLLFIHLADYLEDILGVKVDLLTPDAVKPNRRKYIMAELEYV